MNVRLTPAILCAALASGCSSSPWKRLPPPLYATANLVLLREHLEKDGQRVALGYKHPMKLSADKLASLMSQLSYRHDHLLKSTRANVFIPAEIDASAEPIALALEEIQPDERLRFLIVRSSWSDVLFGPSGTTGVMFSTEDGVLDIALDKIDEGIHLPESNEPMRIAFPDDPTALVDASPLYPPTGTELHTVSGTLHPRWLKARLAEITPTVKSKVAAQPAPATAPPNAAKDPEKEARYQRVRDRLDSLNRLRKDGALAEEQYQIEFQKTMAELDK